MNASGTLETNADPPRKQLAYPAIALQLRSLRLRTGRRFRRSKMLSSVAKAHFVLKLYAGAEARAPRIIIPQCIKQNSVHSGETLGCGTSWSSSCLAEFLYLTRRVSFCRITKLPAKAVGKPSAHTPLS
jgi:hypothetical protein